MRAFGVSPASKGAVLVLDTHPPPRIHTHWTLWSAIFASVIRVPGVSPYSSDYNSALLRRAMRVREAVWVPHGHTSPFYDRMTWSTRPPLLDEFRDFVRRRLSAYNPDAESITKSEPITDGNRCKRLTIVYLSRGNAARRMENENEFVQTLQAAMPSGTDVRTVDMSALSLRDQLLAVHEVDALVGIHGAHFVHMLFLATPLIVSSAAISKAGNSLNSTRGPGAIFELFPQGFSPESHWFYKHMAGLIGLRYAHWTNADPKLEHGNNGTFVPPSVARNCATKLLRLLDCPNKTEWEL